METAPTKMDTSAPKAAPGPKRFLATAKSNKELTKVYPATPETVLMRRKKRKQHNDRQLAIRFKNEANRKLKREEYFKRAEEYVREYRQNITEERRLKKIAQSQNSYYVPAGPKLAFVMRIKGICRVPPKPRKILQLLRLLQINNGVFIKINKATLVMLRMAEPYIAWGYPSLKTVRDLIYKVGYLKVHKQRKAIVDNEMIETKLGKKCNIICIEDLVHEIFTVGPNFTKATNALWPFKLSNPRGGWRRKAKHYVEGGDFGNREEKINKLINLIL